MKLPKLLIADILIVLIGSAGALFFTYLFLQDINATLTRLEEMPVGVITSRYNIAQRRFNNRLVWDRLRNNSPVYNGDVIRTDNLSEVTITFDYGESISLYSNTLIQVFADEGGNRIDFSSGEIIINTSEPGATPFLDNTRRTRRRRTPENLETASSEETSSENSGSERRSDRTGTDRTDRARRSENSEGLVVNTGDQRVRIGRNSAIRLTSLEDGDLELSISEGTVVLEEAPEPQDTTSAQRRRRNQENTENSILAERRERQDRTNSERTGSERTGSERTDRTRRSENTEDTEGTEPAERTDTERTRRTIVINTGEQRIRAERGSSLRIDSQNGELVVETIEPEPPARTRRERTAQDNNTETGIEQRTRTAGSERTGTERTGSEGTILRQREPGAPRELLSAPRNRIPADQHTITPQMIIDSRSLTFSWERVRDANGYILTISRDTEGFRTTLLQTPVLTETSYILENIRRYRGNLFWSIEAVRVSEDGNVEQRGQIRENTLIIDIPRQENATQERSSERRNRSQ